MQSSLVFGPGDLHHDKSWGRSGSPRGRHTIAPVSIPPALAPATTPLPPALNPVHPPSTRRAGAAAVDPPSPSGSTLSSPGSALGSGTGDAPPTSVTRIARTASLLSLTTLPGMGVAAACVGVGGPGGGPGDPGPGLAALEAVFYEVERARAEVLSVQVRRVAGAAPPCILGSWNFGSIVFRPFPEEGWGCVGVGVPSWLSLRPPPPRYLCCVLRYAVLC